MNIFFEVWSILSKKQKTSVVWVLFVIVLMAIIEVVGIGAIFVFMKIVADPERIHDSKILAFLYESLSFETVMNFLVAIGVTTFLFVIFRNIIAAYEMWIRTYFANRLQYSFSTQLLKNYMNRDLLFFYKNNSSSLSKNVLEEVSRLVGGYVLPIITMLSNAVIVAAILIFLLANETSMTLIGFGITGFSYWVIYALFNKRVGDLGKRRLAANEMRFKAIGQAFGGVKEVKLLAKENYFVSYFDKYSREFFDCSVIAKIFQIIPRYVLESVVFGGIIIIVLFLLMNNEDVSDVIGTLTMFGVAIYRAIPRIDGFASSLLSMKFDRAAVELVLSGLKNTKRNHYNENRSQTAHPLSFEDEIKLDNLGFKYPDCQDYAVEGVSLTIKKNSSVAFVGRTGAGKSTLIDVIIGLLNKTSGRMFIDKIEIRLNNIAQWQKNIGYVPQVIYLIDDTVVRNIAFGVPDDEINLENVYRAAQLAHMDEFITSELEYSYDTILGERGVRLSGGQKQRMGIARALYLKPKVLVLDEATSALDGMTEAIVSETIQSLSGNITTIVIAHRFSTVQNCDVIYLMEAGEIVARGTYDELLESNAMFRALGKIECEEASMTESV